MVSLCSGTSHIGVSREVKNMGYATEDVSAQLWFIFGQQIDDTKGFLFNR